MLKISRNMLALLGVALFGSMQLSSVEWTKDAPFVKNVAKEGKKASKIEDFYVIKVSDDNVVVVVRADGKLGYKAFFVDDPLRLVVDFDNVDFALPRTEEVVNSGLLEKVRFGSHVEENSRVRMVVDLKVPVEPLFVEDGWLLKVSLKSLNRDDVTSVKETVSVNATVEEREDIVGVEVELQETDRKEEQRFSSESPLTSVEAFEMAPEPQKALDVLKKQVEAATSGAESFEAQDVTREGKKYFGEPISLSLREADIKEVLRTFAKISGLNIVVHPDVEGEVTVELNQVPWDQALEIILKLNDLGYEMEGNVMRIATRDRLAAEAAAEAEARAAAILTAPLKTVLKRVSYASASEIASVLQAGETSILSERGSVIVDERTNTLIIKELPEFVDTVLAVVEQLDVPEPQILIEARIVETTKRFSRTLGISWNTRALADIQHGNTTGLIFPNNYDISGGVNLLTGGQSGVLGITLGNVLNTFQLDVFLQAAENDGLINILSAPRVTTVNNYPAYIQSGLQIPIQTVANNTVTTQFVNATLRLDVTPHVTAEGTILMDIRVSKREPQLAFAVAGAQNAPIRTREAQTRVIVKDGGTTVIGGIYEITTEDGQDRVPGLSNIPFIGAIFKNKRISDENKELLIFITPRVVKI